MYEDLTRPPLQATVLARALLPDGWRLEVVASAGSTNAVVAERGLAGEPAGLVVVAEHQSAGRGRLDRGWVSPPRAGLTMSVLLQPGWEPDDWPWLPLLAGLAVSQALRDRAGLQAQVKWPNDVLLADQRKVCGVLVQVPSPGIAVLGIGLNVTTTAAELPTPEATSLLVAGASTTDRGTVLRAVLRSLTAVLADPVGARADYRLRCSTLGRQVRVELPGGASVTGLAEAVDDGGRLVVGGVPYGAGDVVHLRAASS